ncbi:MAG: HU family DNA-binding protein [Actinomycetota bacterium]|nr:HU family DNA-binding protein [Actinomycetota bacterium]
MKGDRGMNKAELVSDVSSKTGLSKKDVGSVVDAMQDSITDTLAKGGKVSLVGFGTFQVSNRKARVGLNPRTREKIQIPACTVPKFVAGKGLKEKVR